MPGLRALNMSCNTLTSEKAARRPDAIAALDAVAALSQQLVCSALTSLNLSYCFHVAAMPEMAPALKHMRALRSLVLRGNLLGERGELDTLRQVASRVPCRVFRARLRTAPSLVPRPPHK